MRDIADAGKYRGLVPGWQCGSSAAFGSGIGGICGTVCLECGKEGFAVKCKPLADSTCKNSVSSVLDFSLQFCYDFSTTIML